MQKRHFSVLLFILIALSFAEAQKTSFEAYAVGFYNLENLFDINDDDGVRDTEFTPAGANAWNAEKYTSKLKNMASVIATLGTDITSEGVAILGVSEVENITVLQDLVKEPAIVDRKYEIVHFDSPDKRGIDVALLYNPNLFTVTSSVPFPLLIEAGGKRKFTRDVLLVEGNLQGEKMYILVNHWPSRSGGEKKSSPLRKAAAKLNKQLVDSLYAADPESKIFLMGDLNDDPTSPSVKKVLKAKKKISQVKEKGLFNPMYAMYQKGIGSNAYRDSWSLFDQIIVSEPLLDKKQDGIFFHKAVIYKKPHMLQPSGQYKGYPFRTFGNGVFMNGYSDHFPAVAYLLKRTN